MRGEEPARAWFLPKPRSPTRLTQSRKSEKTPQHADPKSYLPPMWCLVEARTVRNRVLSIKSSRDVSSKGSNGAPLIKAKARGRLYWRTPWDHNSHSRAKFFSRATTAVLPKVEQHRYLKIEATYKWHETSTPCPKGIEESPLLGGMRQIHTMSLAP